MKNGSLKDPRREPGPVSSLGAQVERFARLNAIPLDQAYGLMAIFEHSGDQSRAERPRPCPEINFQLP